ncbi:MAG: hypothetical protein QOJ04_3132 [Caballeronia sp.]|jgi:hypothetical protein|nr:hypothetical protein [Caballeronia sp.]
MPLLFVECQATRDRNGNADWQNNHRDQRGQHRHTD